MLKSMRQYIWVLLYVVLVFQTTLQNTTQGFVNKIITYSDDFICMLFLLLLIARLFQNKSCLVNQREICIILCYVLFIVIGMYSAGVYSYQRIGYVMLDAFVSLKFIIIFFASKFLSRNKIDEQFLYGLNNGLKIAAIILFFLTLHDLLFPPFFEKSEFRYFTYSIKLFFYHPEALARACAGIIYPLAYNMKRYKNNTIYILMLCFVMLFTFRMKSVAAMIIFILLYLYGKYMKREKIVLFFAFLALTSVLIGSGQIKFYFSMPQIARTKLITDSILLANEHYPLGTGFGTFGSNVALEHNSLLYESMGYYDTNNRWAIKSYLNDAFWPIVISQTGWIGTIFFVLSIVCLFIWAINLYKKEFYPGWIMLMVLFYDMISTLGSTAFYHPMSLAGYMFAGIVVSISANKRRLIKIEKEACT